MLPVYVKSDRYRDMQPSSDFTLRLLSEAGLKQGMRVLDIGCGAGDVAFLAASLVGEAGSVVGIDVNEDALAAARQRAEQAARPRPTFIKADLGEPPEDLGLFDAIVGRRVLMYQPDTVAAVRLLMQHLVPAGIVALQELDMTMVPARLVSMPLHEEVLGWLQQMLLAEGADIHMGFHLHDVLTQAGLHVEGVRAEGIVQTPDQHNHLGTMIRAGVDRIVASGAASASHIDIETLQDRLDAERASLNATYIGDMIFGAWARKAADA